MSYAAGRTDGKEPCKQSQHCVGSWRGDVDENNREPYGPSQWSTTKNSKAKYREKTSQLQSNVFLLLSLFSGTFLEVLKWWRMEYRAMFQEGNL